MSTGESVSNTYTTHVCLDTGGYMIAIPWQVDLLSPAAAVYLLLCSIFRFSIDHICSRRLEFGNKRIGGSIISPCEEASCMYCMHWRSRLSLDYYHSCFLILEFLEYWIDYYNSWFLSSWSNGLSHYYHIIFFSPMSWSFAYRCIKGEILRRATCSCDVHHITQPPRWSLQLCYSSLCVNYIYS